MIFGHAPELLCSAEVCSPTAMPSTWHDGPEDILADYCPLLRAMTIQGQSLCSLHAALPLTKRGRHIVSMTSTSCMVKQVHRSPLLTCTLFLFPLSFSREEAHQVEVTRVIAMDCGKSLRGVRMSRLICNMFPFSRTGSSVTKGWALDAQLSASLATRAEFVDTSSHALVKSV